MSNSDYIDRSSAAYKQGVDDGFACKRDGNIPPADIVATWGHDYATREGYHPSVADTVRWWYVCGFASVASAGPACKDYPDGCWRCDSGDRPADPGCYKVSGQD